MKKLPKDTFFRCVECGFKSNDVAVYKAHPGEPCEQRKQELAAIRKPAHPVYLEGSPF